MGWTPPKGAKKWVPPEAAKIVAPPSDILPDSIASLPAVTSDPTWGEAIFPRSASQGYTGDLSALLDVASLPGRAYASLGRPKGEGYKSALARLSPAPNYDEKLLPGQKFADQLLRDPATGVITALSPLAPAWLATLPWMARGLAQGASAGAQIAATRQAERAASDLPVSPPEIGADIALGTLLGGGVSALGRGLSLGTPLAASALSKIAKIPIKMREKAIRSAPEMIRRGVLAPTEAGMLRNMEKMRGEIRGAYNAATQGTEGIPAISLPEAAQTARQKLQRMADRGDLPADAESHAGEWISGRARRPLPAEYVSNPDAVMVSRGLADIPTAIRSRSSVRQEAGSYESMQPTSINRDAMQEAADAYAARINEQMPIAIRRVDEYAAPFYQFEPMIDALGRRGSNFDVGLSEIGAANVNPVLAPLAWMQRRPIYPYTANQVGRIGRQLMRSPRMLSTPTLLASETDNAR